MSDYKENQDHFNPEIDSEDVTTSEAPEDTTSKDDSSLGLDDFKDNGIDDDIVTAVLLIQNRQGAVLPVTNLETLKMDRQANAHEVLRMCADVQDQISAIRVVGELAQIFQHLNQSSLKAVANMLNSKVNGTEQVDVPR